MLDGGVIKGRLPEFGLRDIVLCDHQVIIGCDGGEDVSGPELS
jgi:hypothetical protein